MFLAAKQVFRESDDVALWNAAWRLGLAPRQGVHVAGFGVDVEVGVSPRQGGRPDLVLNRDRVALERAIVEDAHQTGPVCEGDRFDLRELSIARAGRTASAIRTF